MTNGNIPAFACGPLTRERYINERMEIELKNFKFEVESRFKKSAITKYKFPKREFIDVIDTITSTVNKQINGLLTDKCSTLQKRSKTIDDYYEK